MQKPNFIIFILLFFSISSSNNDKELKPYSLYNNTIEINTYKSEIKEAQLLNYQDWISIRNAFFYSNKEKRLSKYEIYFDISNPDYLKKMNDFGLPFFVSSYFTLIFLIFYLIMRFIVKKCQGPKKIEKSYIIQARIILIIGFSFSYILIIFQLYYSIRANSSINNVISFVKEQNEEMNKLYNITLDCMKNISNSPIETENETLNYIKEIYMNESITNDIKIISEKMNKFTNDISNTQKEKFIYNIVYFFLLILFTAAAIFGYFIRRDYFLWISSFFLFILTSRLIYLLGKEMIFSFIGIEFCQNIGNSIVTGIIPSGNKYLGNYISCSSKDTQKKIHTAIYEINESFNIIYNFVLLNVKNKNDNELLNKLINKKRENQTFESIMLKYSDIKGIKNSCYNLINLNYVLSGLLSLSNCRTPKNIINYTEENFCGNTINYMIKNIFFGVLVSISVFILGIGINKHMTVMRKIAETSLRGKKKYNEEILDDDDDKEDDDGVIN